ncbi:hypothetical protein [Nocardia sienata]|uniref:hypothetical protein n=1 Tax=Nocardia sienata TaxID=248552 RepID=UPI000B1D6D6B|nr:hypothetical protein [Nocardia sienata]
MITLGFVVAAGLPLAVLVWALVWPEGGRGQRLYRREAHCDKQIKTRDRTGG